MRSSNTSIFRFKTQWLATLFLMFSASIVEAGAYIAANEARGVDLITYPSGYNFSGTANQLEINVCIVPGSPNAAVMAQSVRNLIAVYNQLLSTSGNLRNNVIPSNQVDFESVALHELGHCLGEAHVNAASESGLPGDDKNYTKATEGANNVFDIDAGVDGVRGSSDDQRGDDINLHWFRTANNNPFSLDYSTVDSTTYARNVANLPAGHLFATNGDRTLASLILNTPNTEAVMQQLTFFQEVQRTLTHDGVATLQYGMSGLDETAGTGDDYIFNLNFATTNCDINLSFDNTKTGFAVCQTGFSYIPNQSSIITSANIYFNTGFNWFFNGTTPCTESISLVPFEWKLFTLPCSVGISTGNTVADVIGDDFAGLDYVTEWVVWKRDVVNDVYVQLLETDELFTGQAYWVITSEAGKTVDFEGQFNGSPDTFLAGIPGGRANLVGNPFDFSVDWENIQIVDGADVQNLAAAVADGDIGEAYYTWNGNAWQALDATTPGMIGTLFKSEGIWMKVMKDGVRLRVPSIVSPVVAAAVAQTEIVNSLNTKPAGTSKINPRNNAVDSNSDKGWFVRVIVESGDLIDLGNVFGQLPDSLNGLDKHDLEELQPFGNSYLTVVFPHDEWGSDAWAYTSDYHRSTNRPAGDWVFSVRSSADVSEVSLRLEGPEKILRKGTLIDLETGKKVKFHKGAYIFDASEGARDFGFRLGKRSDR